MSNLLATSFPVSDVPVAQTRLREIPYAHAVAGLIAAKSPCEELDQLDGYSHYLERQIRRGSEKTCVHCRGSGDCYCKRKGLPASQCVRCNGSGNCHACPELQRRWEREVAELKRQQAELKQRRPQVVASLDAHFQTAAPGIEACSRYHGRLVAGVTFHPVVAGVHLAFCDHRPLVLSPDMIWLLVAQGFANHVNANAEELRPRLVKHSGKLVIEVRRDDFIKGSPENPWPGVFDEFTDRIREHIGDATHHLLLPTFSTTGVTERAAAQVVLLDALQSFFTYVVVSICGIPEVMLEGTAEDWEMLAERTRDLGRFGLEWWTEPLAPVLDEFVAAARGQVNVRFWQSIYKLHDASGGPFVSGWITAFFPYLKDRQTGQTTNKNQWLLRGGTDPEELLYPPAVSDPYDRGCGPTTEEFPAGLARAPFLWEYPGHSYDMEFLGGFVGVRQDADSLALRPEIGWAICEQAAAS